MRNLKLNHIGIVVKNIEDYIIHSLPFEEYTVVNNVIDNYQEARIILISPKFSPYIELIQPLSEKSSTFNFLNKNGDSIHHMCFEVENLEELDKILIEKKIKKITSPVKAPLFNNKKVVFGYTKNRNIIEFLIINS